MGPAHRLLAEMEEHFRGYQDTDGYTKDLFERVRRELEQYDSEACKNLSSLDMANLHVSSPKHEQFQLPTLELLERVEHNALKAGILTSQCSSKATLVEPSATKKRVRKPKVVPVFNPYNDCMKNHRQCEAPDLCGKYGNCMGA